MSPMRGTGRHRGVGGWVGRTGGVGVIMDGVDPRATYWLVNRSGHKTIVKQKYTLV